ncbi:MULTISPECIES: Fur family transcriptional regulator [Fluviispira]|uniref:Ferric uptake regulation protein n=1 Tax=Fluviispira sanaruensis TaxID=2493639 RepID=A0A4P2VI02_FLUSA|nr:MULTISPECIES: transcriptional repressor [Fluviispira]BBH52616.1 transcriptional repressor [Fluviispira sanaruensis]
MTTARSPRDSLPKRAHLHQVFESYLNQLGLRQTRQRRIILDAVLASGRHVDAETIANEVKKTDSSIGLATVYRTLKMMTDSQILVERHFGGDRASFEFADQGDEHHDHLICKQCGEIVEFYDADLEKRQEEVAKNLGYKLIHHKMELFAECLGLDKCERKNSK